MQIQIVIVLLVTLALTFGAATPCTLSTNSLTLTCQQLVSAADLDTLDVSEVNQVLIRGSQVNWDLISARMPSLTSTYCLLPSMECTGHIPSIETDCSCLVPTAASPSTLSPPLSPSVLLGSIFRHIEAQLPVPTGTRHATFDFEQCPAVYRQGVSRFLAGIPNSECFSTFLEGWQGILVLLLATLIGGGCTLLTGSVALWRTFRVLLRVSNLKTPKNIIFIFQ
jgi:hypothetical protein